MMRSLFTVAEQLMRGNEMHTERLIISKPNRVAEGLILEGRAQIALHNASVTLSSDKQELTIKWYLSALGETRERQGLWSMTPEFAMALSEKLREVAQPAVN